MLAEGIHYLEARGISAKLQETIVRDSALVVAFRDKGGAAQAVQTVVSAALRCTCRHCVTTT